MVDYIFDLSQNLVSMVELGIQHTHLLIDGQEIGDAIIL